MYWLSRSRQPAYRDFGLERIVVDGWSRPVSMRSSPAGPFCTCREFDLDGEPADRPVVVVAAPLSGHFAFIMREVVAGLLPTHRVLVTDWTNAAHVPVSFGAFGFDDNIATIVALVRAARAGGPVTLLGICQSVVPSLAAAAILADRTPPHAPDGLVLIAGPVDPLANPTTVVDNLRQHPLAWYRDNVLRPVEDGLPGGGRMVYPAETQLAALEAYWGHHYWDGGEIFLKSTFDDGLDPVRFPFEELYASIMDLPAEFFIDNIDTVFHRTALVSKSLTWRGRKVDCSALTSTALMTIEGGEDNIAAPGQTRAAHDLSPEIDGRRRGHLLVPRAGHFSLIHGSTWRNDVLPSVLDFLTRSVFIASEVRISP